MYVISILHSDTVIQMFYYNCKFGNEQVTKYVGPYSNSVGGSFGKNNTCTRYIYNHSYRFIEVSNKDGY